jgi:hypothetical protein
MPDSLLESSSLGPLLSLLCQTRYWILPLTRSWVYVRPYTGVFSWRALESSSLDLLWSILCWTPYWCSLLDPLESFHDTLLESLPLEPVCCPPKYTLYCSLHSSILWILLCSKLYWRLHLTLSGLLFTRPCQWVFITWPSEVFFARSCTGLDPFWNLTWLSPGVLLLYRLLENSSLDSLRSFLDPNFYWSLPY